MRYEDAERRYAQIEGERDYYKRLADSRDKALTALKEKISKLESALNRQAKAAISGMDAAKAVAGSNLEHATRLRAECSPEALESERAANALLTEQAAKLEAHIAALQDDIEIHRAAEEAQIALREKAEEREQALWETLIKVADHIGVDCQAARGKDGKPSDVYLEHINRVKTLAQADELANCCDILTDRGHVDAAIEVHSLSQERRQQAEAQN